MPPACPRCVRPAARIGSSEGEHRLPHLRAHCKFHDIRSSEGGKLLAVGSPDAPAARVQNNGWASSLWRASESLPKHIFDLPAPDRKQVAVPRREAPVLTLPPGVDSKAERSPLTASPTKRRRRVKGAKS